MTYKADEHLSNPPEYNSFINHMLLFFRKVLIITYTEREQIITKDHLFKTKATSYMIKPCRTLILYV